MMPRTCGDCPPSGEDIAEPNAPPEDHLINARLGPAPLPLPPPIPQAVDTAIANAQAFRPPAAEPDPSSAPEETSILRDIAQESENAGHRLKSWAEEQATIVLLHFRFAQEMEQHGERMIALSNNSRSSPATATPRSTRKASPSEAHPSGDSRKVSPSALPHGFALLARVVLRVVARLRPARHGLVMLVCFG